MSPDRKPLLIRLGLLAAVIFAYFVLYTEDLDSILSPLQKVLALSAAVSPWFYVFAGTVVLAWTAVRIWGADHRATLPPAEEQPF